MASPPVRLLFIIKNELCDNSRSPFSVKIFFINPKRVYKLVLVINLLIQNNSISNFIDIYDTIPYILPEFCTQLTAMIGGEKFSCNPADRGWEPAALQAGLSLGIKQPEVVFNI
jgi:hypothetical protein